MTAHPSVAALRARFGAALVRSAESCGDTIVWVAREPAHEVLAWLRDDPAQAYDYLVDVTAAHYPQRELPFDVIWILYSFEKNERIRVKARIADGYKPQSAVSVHLSANWLEREVFDMFGIQFDGHPDMRRILLPEEWQGYPLRKDYSILQQDDRWVQENLGIESGH